jgi:hypothetical protein
MPNYDPNQIRPKNFVYDNVIYFDGQISIIFGTYKDNPLKTVGIRWITEDDFLGHPNAHGNPTWMPLPDKLALVMLEGLWQSHTEKEAIREGFQAVLEELSNRFTNKN